MSGIGTDPRVTGIEIEMVGGPHDGLLCTSQNIITTLDLLTFHDPISGLPGEIIELPVELAAGRWIMRWDARIETPITG